MDIDPGTQLSNFICVTYWYMHYTNIQFVTIKKKENNVKNP